MTTRESGHFLFQLLTIFLIFVKKEYMLYQNYSLIPHNTFGLNVATKYFFEYSSEEELRNFLKSELFQSNSYLHIGAGSNLLFLNDFNGLILHSNIKGIEIIDETDDAVVVRVGAGVVWDDFVAYCVKKGFYGAENLSIIPGEVGSSAVQNIGAYGVEAKDLIFKVEAIEIVSGNKRIFDVSECEYAYRSSIFKHALAGKYFITYVQYKLSKKESFNLSYGNLNANIEGEPTLQKVRQTVVSVRESKLPNPKVLGNAGSYFMNPVVEKSIFDKLYATYPQMPYYEVDDKYKIPAAWLIDQCGWKGKSLGNAGVHEKQALVLINKGTATGADIVHLEQAIITDVETKFGITLHPEVILVK